MLADALARQRDVCEANCACARRPARSIGTEPNRTASRNIADVAQSAACPTALDARAYLTAVYPVAAARIARLTPDAVVSFFDSLHFFYDFGCSQHALSGCNELQHEPSVLLRWLYGELLPCSEQPTPRGRLSLGACVAAHFGFRPAWARLVMTQGWAEVEHRAIGFGVHRAALSAPTAAPALTRPNGQPQGASDFLDAGAASMWHVYRRGSGIFYDMGKAKLAPGKTAMVAALLRELATRRANDTALRWPGVAGRAKLFAPSAPSLGASADAQRLLAVARGDAPCADKGVQLCRCRYILQDEWDDAMIWLARVLGYETLFFSATLLCNQPYPNGSIPNRRLFATAYPELVDVRPLSHAMVADQGRGVHSPYFALRPAEAERSATANAERGSSSGTADGAFKAEREVADVRGLRKLPHVAEAWVRKIRAEGRLTLRDPFATRLADEAAAPPQPCHFNVSRWTLQCDAHVSSRWPQMAWHRCGVPTCGYRGARVLAPSQRGHSVAW